MRRPTWFAGPLLLCRPHLPALSSPDSFRLQILLQAGMAMRLLQHARQYLSGPSDKGGKSLLAYLDTVCEGAPALLR